MTREMTRDLRRHPGPGLYCVELRTDNWPRLVEWYRTVLGPRVLVVVVVAGYALLGAGETRIALLARKDAEDVSRRISLAFEVEDVPQLVQKLAAAGSPISYPLRDPEGLREANTDDPDGNRSRLFAWPQGRG